MKTFTVIITNGSTTKKIVYCERLINYPVQLENRLKDLKIISHSHSPQQSAIYLGLPYPDVPIDL